MRFVELLKQARKADGITQKSLARLVGVSDRTMQRWEDSELGKHMNLEQFQELCQILHIHIDGVHVGDDITTFLDQDMDMVDPKAVRALMFAWQDRMRKIGFKISFTMHNEVGQDVTHGGY